MIQNQRALLGLIITILGCGQVLETTNTSSKGLHFPFEVGCENSDLEAAERKGLIAITEPDEEKCG